MGISIDYAATVWTKESQTLTRPYVTSTFQEADAPEHFNEFYHLLNANGGLVYMGDFIDSSFTAEKFDHYVERTNDFLEAVSSTRINDPLQDWLLSQQGNLIHFDYDQFLSSPRIETYTANKWQPSGFLPINEDGKNLMSAISNFGSLYGVSLSPLLFSRDSLDDYVEGSAEGNHLDMLLSADTTPLADVLEFALSRVKQLPGDVYFEDRLTRLHSLVDVIRSGGKLVYSV